MKLSTVIVCSLAAAYTGVSWAQTRIDLRTQGKSIDFSSASMTRPSRTGTQLTATCQIGETFLKTDAAPGANWYVCLAGNLWTAQGIALNAAAPSAGQALIWSGSQWSATTLPVLSLFGRTGAVTAQTGDYTFLQIAGTVGSGQLPAAAGDLTGALSTPTVAKLQNRPVSSGIPSAGQVLTWTGSQWAPANAAGGVTSVFGRTGAVAAQAGDYAAAQVTNAVDKTAANSYTAGARQSFISNTTTAGLQVTPATLPATALAGDVALDSGDSNKLKYYNGASWVSMAPTVTPGNYAAFFGNQTAVVIPGVSHQLGTANLLVQCYDTATPANLIEPSGITVDPNSYNVTIAFPVSQSGRCVINGYNGGGSGGSGGGAGMAAQLGDFAATRTSPGTLTIGANCSPSSPCNTRFGNQVYTITNSSAVTITDPNGTGAAYLYVDWMGTLTVGSSMALSCAGHCTVASGVSAFPANSIPLYTWTASGGSWDLTGATDRRGWLASMTLVSGTGMVTVQSGGQTTVAVDSAVVPTFLTSTATLAFPLIAAGTCSADLTFSLTGANPGDAVSPGWPSGLAPGLNGLMRVSAPGVVAVRLCADATASVHPASASFTATVVRSF